MPVKESGAAIGGLIGYDWLVSPGFVVGLDVEALWTDVKNRSTAGGIVSITASNSLEWLISARARVGLLLSENMLAYVRGGAAFGNVESTASAASVLCSFGGGVVCPLGSVSDTKAGWTIGVGVDYALNSEWQAGVSYDYVDLGTQTVNATAGGTFPTSFSMTNDLQYQFIKGSLVRRFAVQ